MDVLTPGTATSSAPGSNLSEPISTSSVLMKQPTATNIDQEGTPRVQKSVVGNVVGIVVGFV
jgi:hypothetical protein